MTYMIQARLDQGAPTLTLVDAVTGEKRLDWRGDNAINNECDWQSLFKRLMLLSCADRVSLMERAKSSNFGEECVTCTGCVDDVASTEIPTSLGLSATAALLAQPSHASLLRLSR